MVVNFYYQPASVTSYHGWTMSAVTIRCQKSYYMEQWTVVVVAEEDRLNHGRTTSGNGHASHCRRFCVSQTT